MIPQETPMAPYVASRLPRVLPIALLGDPVLGSVSATVHDISSPDIQELIADMLQTMFHYDAVGLAAPQVSRPLRIIVIAPRPTVVHPDVPEMEPIVMINPTIKAKSHGTEWDWEGCLSVTGLYAQIARHISVSISYTDQYGKKFDAVLDRFPARVFQHEFDHLNGCAFIHHPMREAMMESEYLSRIVDTHRTT